jgi:hypothetical protein
MVAAPPFGSQGEHGACKRHANRLKREHLAVQRTDSNRSAALWFQIRYRRQIWAWKKCTDARKEKRQRRSVSEEEAHDIGLWHELVQQFQPLRRDECVELRDTCDVLAWLVEISNEPELDRIETGLEDDRNGCFRGLRCERRRCAGRGDHGRLLLHKIGHQGRQPIGMVLRPTVFDLHIAAIDVVPVGNLIRLASEAESRNVSGL